MIFHNKSIRLAFLAVILLSFLVSVTVVARRYTFERKNNHVELAVSLNEINRLALTGSMERNTLLLKLKEESHITSIAIEEDTLQDFINRGLVTLLKGSEIMNLYRVGHVNHFVLTNLYKKIKVDANRTYVIVETKEDYERIRDFLTVEFGRDNVRRIGNLNILEVMDDVKDLLNVGLGISKVTADELNSYGFSVIPRLKNSPRLNKDLIRMKFRSLDPLPDISTLLFDGNTILGFPTELQFTLEKINDKKLNLGIIEFSKQAGMKNLALQMPNSVLRVHSIPQAVMNKISHKRAETRYVRAAKERGARILLLHPFFDTYHGKNNVDENVAIFKRIYERLIQHGFTVAPIKVLPTEGYESAKPWEIFVMSLGVFATLIWAMNYFIKFTALRFVLSLFTVGLTFYFSNLFGWEPIWTRFIAVLAAVIFPTIGIISQFPPASDKDVPALKHWLNAGAYLLKIWLICLVGAFFIAGLLSDITYILGIRLFFGVKISFVLPLIIVALFFFLRPHRITSVYYVFKRLFFAPVRTLELVSVLFCILFVFLYILRSGNYISFHVPIIEDRMREFLETVFFVRPRTKEFLIGYPFLFLAFNYVDRGLNRTWVWFFNGLGTVALISLVNSFCHIHTPLLISLYRSFLGLALGICVGVTVYIGHQILKIIFRRLTL